MLTDIKEVIRLAKSIVINVHRNPDLDTVGSSEALQGALSQMGKNAVRICPDPIPASFSFLTATKNIQTVDFMKYDFGRHDLFLILDTGSISHLTGQQHGQLPKIKTIVIDHHSVNTVPADIRLINTESSSTAEIIYNIMKVWNIEIDQKIATALAAGILSDTQLFRFSGNRTKEIDMVSDLIKKGADKNAVCEAMFGHMELNRVKLYGRVISEVTVVEKRYAFVFIDHATFLKYGSPKGVRDAASDYLRGIEGIEYAVVGIEEKPGELFLSFRSRVYEVSRLASALGGGGHKQAAGATVYDTFEQAKNKVMQILSSSH